MTDREKTELIESSRSFSELFINVKICDTFTSLSREIPRTYSVDEVVTAIFQLIDGKASNHLTRANGLRAKVLELTELN